METQEDRLRRMKREREGTASASWELNPGVPRATGVAQSTWTDTPKPTSTAQSSWGPPQTSTAQVTWSPNTPEGLAAEITKPKPVVAAAKQPEFSRDETLEANIQQDFQNAMSQRPAVSPALPDATLDANIQKDFQNSMSQWGTKAPVSPEARPQSRSDRMSAEAAAMSEEQFTDAFKRQLTARDAKLMEAQFVDKFKSDLQSRDAALTQEANANAMIERIRSAQSGGGGQPQMSALAQQMMYRPDGSVRPVPSRAMLDKWSEIDGLAGRRRESGKHVAVQPTQPNEEQLARILGIKPATPYDWSKHSEGVRNSPQYAEAVRRRAGQTEDATESGKPPVAAQPVSLQEPEAPKPEEVAAERPKMEPQDPKAAVQPEPVPMPSKPMNPQQRMLAGRSQWRNIEEKNAALVPHYQEAARLLGLGDMDGDTFGALSPEVAGRLQRKAHSLQRQASSQQFNDRLSDRNQSREQNVPMALATAQRLQGRGRALMAQAGGLHDSDPQKAILQAQGEQMLAQGDAQHGTFMTAWQRQADANISRQVMQAAMMFGREGAGIVESHLRGQAAIQQQQLVNAGQLDQQHAANAGQAAVARINVGGNVQVAGIDAGAKAAEAAAARIERKAELDAKLKENGLDRAQRAELDGLNRIHDKDKQTVAIAQQEKERLDRKAQNPIPLTPPQLFESFKAADGNDDDPTSVQQHVDNFSQTLAGQQGMNDTQREMQSRQAVSWANKHVMSRMERGKLRDSDKQYIRSLAYTKEGKLKDLSAFVREIGSSYGGSNWKAMAKQLADFHTALAAEEQAAGLDKKVTQVGIPDNPVV